MKKLLPLLAAIATFTISAIAGTGPGPWADGGYYQNYLNGKYMGIVTQAAPGNIITGVVGFAIIDGAPPYRTIQNPAAIDGGGVKVYEYDNPRIDVLQNYFAIFVDGRTYTGLTTAGIDINSGTIAGALQGTDPIGVQAVVTGAPGPGAFNFDASDALSIVNRGLSGGFLANINTKQSIFTFSGSGNLSTPSQPQTITISAVPEIPPTVAPPPTVPAGTTTNEVITGLIQTVSVPFNIRGTRTSFISSNPAAQSNNNNAAQ